MRKLKPSLISLAFFILAPSSHLAFGESSASDEFDDEMLEAPKQGSASSQGPLDNDAEFARKLRLMLERTDISIKIIREQIIQNQSAPFLADLYLQLGDLLTEKSTVLYYLQMQGDKRTDNKISATQKFSPVVVTAQEAIVIYEQILKEFPKFDKRDKVLYRLAVGQKSIDESAAFVKTAELLIKDYPNTKEAIQVRLLLGQHFYDMSALEDALAQLKIVEKENYPFERNAARYRIGLIHIMKEQYTDALRKFETVALDEELKEEQNPAELSLKAKSIKSNLKREALIDSVRAYTEVYKDAVADPVGYYARIAPTESLFQETIEKLSFRYIFLKRYNSAIKLLRVLSERISDPQKVMNIYQDVLVMIPVEQRLDVPVQEMAYVLDKYNDWSTHYNLAENVKKETYLFFEKQIRELGTKSHDLAKVAASNEKKSHLFERARVYYHLYLGFFNKSPEAVKIAINLGDVYYNQRNFFQSATFYLRALSGEFGQPKQKVELVQNTIMALQKPSEYAYYEELRAKGMMVKAVSTYMGLDPRKRDDPGLNFALAKAYFEQGYYDRAIKDLFKIYQRFPNQQEGHDSVEMILSYFNTRSDFKQLAAWSQKMLAVNTQNSQLKTRLKDVYAKAQLRRLDEQVKTQKNYDVMAQGKSYLQTALAIDDSSLRSTALQQALGHSRSERDTETFFRTALAMAKSEKVASKRAEILRSIAEESLGITRFYQALKTYQRIAGDGGLPQAERQSAFDRSVRVASMLRDVEKMVELLSQPMASSLPSETRESAEQGLVSMVESGVGLPERAQGFVIRRAQDDSKLLSLFKKQNQFSPSHRQLIMTKVNERCASGGSAAVCKWTKWSMMSAQIAKFEKEMALTPPKMQAIEGAAAKMSGLLDATKAYEGSGEALVDMMVTLGNSQIYRAFGDFLNRAAEANRELAPVLKAKSKESLQASKVSRDQCGKILQAGSLQKSKFAELCSVRSVASISSTLEGGARTRLNPPGGDFNSSDIREQEKNLFVNRKDWKGYFNLGELYLQKKNWHHAAATAAMARTAFPQSEEEFNAILGCALTGSGLMGEAEFVLKKASDMNGHKSSCMAKIRSAKSAGA